MAKEVTMTGNVLGNDFYHNMLEVKCDALRDLMRNQEACDRYERLSHITNKVETIGGTRWNTSIGGYDKWKNNK